MEVQGKEEFGGLTGNNRVKPPIRFVLNSLSCRFRRNLFKCPVMLLSIMQS